MRRPPPASPARARRESRSPRPHAGCLLHPSISQHSPTEQRRPLRTRSSAPFASTTRPVPAPGWPRPTGPCEDMAQARLRLFTPSPGARFSPQASGWLAADPQKPRSRSLQAAVRTPSSTCAHACLEYALACRNPSLKHHHRIRGASSSSINIRSPRGQIRVGLRCNTQRGFTDDQPVSPAPARTAPARHQGVHLGLAACSTRAAIASASRTTCVFHLREVHPLDALAQTLQPHSRCTLHCAHGLQTLLRSPPLLPQRAFARPSRSPRCMPSCARGLQSSLCSASSLKLVPNTAVRSAACAASVVRRSRDARSP